MDSTTVDPRTTPLLLPAAGFLARPLAADDGGGAEAGRCALRPCVATDGRAAAVAGLALLSSAHASQAWPEERVQVWMQGADQSSLCDSWLHTTHREQQQQQNGRDPQADTHRSRLRCVGQGRTFCVPLSCSTSR